MNSSEIVLKVVLNTLNPNLTSMDSSFVVQKMFVIYFCNKGGGCACTVLWPFIEW